MCRDFRAASLRQHLDAWKKIGASDAILTVISEGVKLDFNKEPYSFSLPNHKVTPVQSSFIGEEIKKLVISGALKSVDYRPKCVSPLGCVNKKGGKLRLITDLREINASVTVPKFRYEDVSSLQHVVESHDFMITWDFKNGFHHVPIHTDFQDYLGICHRGRYYVWTVLPFGLNVSPYYFQKVTRTAITYLRSEGLKVASYVDDGLLSAAENLIISHRNKVLQCFEDLGWHLNYDKSSLDAEQRKEFLGYTVLSTGKSDNPELQVPHHKLRKLRHDLRRLLKKESLSARTLARVAGLCISLTRAILPGKLMLRGIYRLLATKASWESPLVLNDEVRQEMTWWIESVGYWNGTTILPKTIQAQIWTDASHWGWGATLNGQYAQGFWSQLSRVVHGANGHRVISGRDSRKTRSDSVRQYCDTSVLEPPRWSLRKAERCGDGNLDAGVRVGHNLNGKTCARGVQWCRRQLVTLEPPPRMATESKRLYSTGSQMGSPRGRSFCNDGEHSDACVQQPLSRSLHVGGRCPSSTRLGGSQQLCKPSISSTVASVGHNRGAKGACDNNCSSLEQPDLVSKTLQNVSRPTIPNSEHEQNISYDERNSRTSEELQVEDLRVESMWRRRLLCEGWSERCSYQLPMCLAKSTLELYNRLIRKLHGYCSTKQLSFPVVEPHIFAEYYVQLLIQVNDLLLSSDRLLQLPRACVQLQVFQTSHGMQTSDDWEKLS